MKTLAAIIATLSLTLLGTLTPNDELQLSSVQYCERVDLYEQTVGTENVLGHRNFKDIDCDAVWDLYLKQTKVGG